MRRAVRSSFDENAQFPHGLAWLSERLRGLGLDLGVWKAPYTVSAHDPVAKEHPEWIMKGKDGRPAPSGWHDEMGVGDFSPGFVDELLARPRPPHRGGDGQRAALGHRLPHAVRQRNAPVLQAIVVGITVLKRVGIGNIGPRAHALRHLRLKLLHSGAFLAAAQRVDGTGF